jgi:hypothetical protein
MGYWLGTLLFIIIQGIVSIGINVFSKKQSNGWACGHHRSRRASLPANTCAVLSQAVSSLSYNFHRAVLAHVSCSI